MSASAIANEQGVLDGETFTEFENAVYLILYPHVSVCIRGFATACHLILAVLKHHTYKTLGMSARKVMAKRNRHHGCVCTSNSNVEEREREKRRTNEYIYIFKMCTRSCMCTSMRDATTYSEFADHRSHQQHPRQHVPPLGFRSLFVVGHRFSSELNKKLRGTFELEQH